MRGGGRNALEPKCLRGRSKLVPFVLQQKSETIFLLRFIIKTIRRLILQKTGRERERERDNLEDLLSHDSVRLIGPKIKGNGKDVTGPNVQNAGKHINI